MKDNLIPQLVETSLYTAGFHDKLAQDELPSGAATGDSFNFIIDKDGKWTTRSGSQYLGTKATDTGGCTSSGKILRRDGIEIPIVFYATKSKYLHPDTLDWRILENTYTSGLIFGRAVGEKVADNVNKLVFGNGVDTYRIWDGLTGTVASFTANTIVLTGAVTLANRGFTATGSISNNGVLYAYTGLSGSTFTGVTPDPTATGMVNGDAIASLPVTSGSLPLGNVMASLNGRVVMGTKPAAALYGGGSIVGSKLNLYDDFAFSATRVASEGFQLMMAEGGGNLMGLVQFEGGVAAFKQNAVSRLAVTLDQYDAPSMAPLLPYDETASGHVGLVGQKIAFALRNQVFFVSPRKVINTLQRISQVDYPQSLAFSDRIQNTVDDMGWDEESCGIGFNYFAMFSGKAIPTDNVPNKILIYDQRFDCWWTPLTGWEISSFFVYGGNLYGTLASSPDVVKLFTGVTDYATASTLGNPINAKLTLEKQNFGKKSMQKKARRIYLEGWMSKVGTATVTITFNENGNSYSGVLHGNEDQYFFDPPVGGEFGTEGFGVETFGGSWLATSDLPDGVGHFRILFTYPPKSFWNMQLSIETSNYFKIINHSPDARISDVGFPQDNKAALA
jgi:hypothetical protein